VTEQWCSVSTYRKLLHTLNEWRKKKRKNQIYVETPRRYNVKTVEKVEFSIRVIASATARRAACAAESLRVLFVRVQCASFTSSTGFGSGESRFHRRWPLLSVIFDVSRRPKQDGFTSGGVATGTSASPKRDSRVQIETTHSNDFRQKKPVVLRGRVTARTSKRNNFSLWTASRSFQQHSRTYFHVFGVQLVRVQHRIPKTVLNTPRETGNRVFSSRLDDRSQMNRVPKNSSCEPISDVW